MIRFDAKSNGAATTSSPLTWSHTCGSDATLLVVGFSIAGMSSSQRVTAVTYNGVSMTQVGTAIDSGTNAASISLWYLLSPASGTNTISATLSSILSVNGAALSFSGVSAYDTTATKTTAVTDPTNIDTRITVSGLGNIVVDILNVNATGTPGITSTGTQTVYHNQIANTGSDKFDMSAYIYNAVGNPVSFTYSYSGASSEATHRLASFTSTSFVNHGVNPNSMRPRPFTPGIAR